MISNIVSFLVTFLLIFLAIQVGLRKKKLLDRLDAGITSVVSLVCHVFIAWIVLLICLLPVQFTIEKLIPTSWHSVSFAFLLVISGVIIDLIFLGLCKANDHFHRRRGTQPALVPLSHKEKSTNLVFACLSIMVIFLCSGLPELAITVGSIILGKYLWLDLDLSSIPATIACWRNNGVHPFRGNKYIPAWILVSVTTGIQIIFMDELVTVIPGFLLGIFLGILLSIGYWVRCASKEPSPNP